jgi:hypothetical protein
MAIITYHMTKYNILLYIVTVMLSGSTYPTSNQYYTHFWRIACRLKSAQTDPDAFIRRTSAAMREKFQKYWDLSMKPLAIACTLDPRFKLRFIEHSLKKFCDTEEDASTQVLAIKCSLNELFTKYSISSAAESTEPAENNASLSMMVIQENQDLLDFECQIQTSSSDMVRTELDRYLDEPNLPGTNRIFPILDWWKPTHNSTLSLEK